MSAPTTQKFNTPKKPTTEPDEEDVKIALAEVAEHTESTLTMKNIIRFILVKPRKRFPEWWIEWEFELGDNIPVKIEQGLKPLHVLMLIISTNTIGLNRNKFSTSPPAGSKTENY